ncbi:addiction module toxin RelE [Spirochaetia bacterium]|nr:addiction module toxin RelE [Spirochaetia bacterium]
MRIFKTKRFSKDMKKAGVSDIALKEAAGQVENFTDLGGDVYKLRFAREGEGKSGGYRFILFFRQGDKLFFRHAFAKSVRDNITDKELRHFKDMAKDYFALSDIQIDLRKKQKTLIEL